MVSKVNKQHKQKLLSLKKRLERDIKDCMRCAYFWGNDRRCMNSHCIKENKKEVQKSENSECMECPYKQGNGYCFPCMKKLLEKKANKKNVDDQKED